MKLRFVFILLFLLAGCSQNVDFDNSGERLSDSPKPKVDPNAAPLARAGGESSDEPKIPPFVKAYFMHTWVEALYSTPGNKHPNPKWQSPLKDPENGRVRCTDCHGDKFDFAKMPKQRFPQIDALENDHEFMVELMTKWVGRLNSDEYKAKAKLKGTVQCTTCHEKDPREEGKPESL